MDYANFVLKKSFQKVWFPTDFTALWFYVSYPILSRCLERLVYCQMYYVSKHQDLKRTFLKSVRLNRIFEFIITRFMDNFFAKI